MTPPHGESHARTVEIINERGLHARASAEFVRVAEFYDAEVIVSKASDSTDGERVCGTSIMGLMMLAAARGNRIRIETRGLEAVEALDALEKLVNAKFNED